jgi:beta-galactosidase
MNQPTRLPRCERVLYGADYNPDQWLGEDAVLREDIALMRQVGATSASIGIFAWTALEPSPGVYTFQWLDETMERFAKAGLSVFLATPSASKPMWLSELHPEIRRVGRDGRREPSGGRHNHCPTSPVYRAAVARINRELAARYGKHPALALWHVGNELNGECHCELCINAFRDWLKRRHGSLAELNRAWWTSFWNHTFTDWSQIPSFDPSNDGLTVDWLRFVNDQHVSFLENEMAPLRELSPGVPCTTNFMGTNRGTNYWQWSRSLDCISNDIYPLHDDRADSWRKALGSDFIHSLMRGLAGGGPWLLMECSPSSVNWNKVNKLKRPGVHLQEVLQAVANGADAVHYFQWRKGLGGHEKFHGAVIDHAGGSDSRVFRECAEVGRVLQTLAPVAGLAPERAPVAIVYDWEARWALDASAGPKKAADGDRYTETCLAHFRALRCAGVEVDLISADADFSAYRVVVTPALYALPAATARRLSAFAAAGGGWVATYLTGYVDEHNRCWRGGFPGPELRAVFGLWNEEVDYLFDDEKVRVEGALFDSAGGTFATDIVERVHAEGAQTLATATSEFYAGSPVLLRNGWELGDTFYLSARLSEEGCIAFYEYLARELNLPRLVLPRGVVRKTRVGADGPIEFLFNYTREEVAVDLGEERFHRLADGQTCRGKTTLRPYDSLLKGVLPACVSPLAPHHPHPTRHEPQASALPR